MSNTPFTLVVLGGTSAIALSYTRKRLATELADKRAVSVVLAGRQEARLNAEAADLRARGASVTVAVCDLAQVCAVQSQVLAAPQIDEVILAYGSLTDQSRAQSELAYLEGQLTTNFASAALWLEAVAQRFQAQGQGRAVVIGSVAGDRGRQSNYAYGAAKGGLDRFVQGMQHRFAPLPNIRITLVKPGFVDTPMTAEISPKGALWAMPDRVAADIEQAVLKGRRVVYTPWFWRIIMAIIVTVPSFIFHKTKL